MSRLKSPTPSQHQKNKETNCSLAKSSEPMLIDAKELQSLLLLSRQTIDRYVSAGKFPVKIYVSQRRVRWLRSEVLNWLQERANARKFEESQIEQVGMHNIFSNTQKK
jgi:predicted DNA-binding transcriptional regulator AlpA